MGSLHPRPNEAESWLGTANATTPIRFLTVADAPIRVTTGVREADRAACWSFAREK